MGIYYDICNSVRSDLVHVHYAFFLSGLWACLPYFRYAICYIKYFIVLEGSCT